jgi:hypothetical protein
VVDKWIAERNVTMNHFKSKLDDLLDELEHCCLCQHSEIADDIRAKIHKLVECRWNKLIFTRNSDVEYINSGNLYTVENLPEYDEQVIVTNGKDVWIDAFNDMGDGVWLSETDDDIDGVVAWMELPEPYKEG